jgi:hypothetical protein
VKQLNVRVSGELMEALRRGYVREMSDRASRGDVNEYSFANFVRDGLWRVAGNAGAGLAHAETIQASVAERTRREKRKKRKKRR